MFYTEYGLRWPFQIVVYGIVYYVTTGITQMLLGNNLISLLGVKAHDTAAVQWLYNAEDIIGNIFIGAALLVAFRIMNRHRPFSDVGFPRLCSREIRKLLLGMLIGAASIAVIAAVLVLESLRAKIIAKDRDVSLNPGDIPVYKDGELLAAVNSEDLADLQMVQFTDAEQGKVQEGWLILDIMKKYFETRRFSDSLQFVFSSSSRNKSIALTWEEIAEPENMVMFDLSGRGTLKLVSKLEKLDVRDEWVQDVDRIEIIEP